MILDQPRIGLDRRGGIFAALDREQHRSHQVPVQRHDGGLLATPSQSQMANTPYHLWVADMPSHQPFVRFIEERMEALRMNQSEFERRIMDRWRNVKQGRQKPPLATLHRWAEALELDEAGRLRLLELADEAHGGGTIASWIVETIRRVEKDAGDRDRIIAKLSVKLEQIEHRKDKP
jgi:hypothetical protein